MEKLSPDIAKLLNPQINAEAAARYFYEAARTWGRKAGYPGAERQFSCYVHYHKHNLKMLLNIFADWEGVPTYSDISKPDSFFVALPDVLGDALSVEQKLMDAYNAVTHDLYDLHLGIFDQVNKLRKRETGFFQEMAEYNEKLKLFNVKNGLDLVYFDRKILRW